MTDPFYTRLFTAPLMGTALATMLMVSPALAQEEPTDADDASTSEGAEETQMASTGGIERMQVTAQKTEEDVLDVPIAVTAFDAGALDIKQIDNFSDLQFNTPNVTFTAGNFTSDNLQIRGIGNTLVATSADTGVGIHVNNVYLLNPRILEVEYFDIASVEVLRGPQGTLFGRNATGGTVNIQTARPEMNEYTANIDAQFGNFNHRRVKGFVNVPIIEDKLAARFAGIYLERDGYSENIFNGQDVDGRDQYAIRGSLRFTPTETTTIDIIASFFKEESDRVRSAKQLCNRDPSAVLGCLPDSLQAETTNGLATLAGLLTSDAVLPPALALQSFFAGEDPNANAINPTDLRTVNLDFQPNFEADETFVMAAIEQELPSNITLNIEAAYQDTQRLSQQDYNSVFSDDRIEVPEALAVALPNTFNALFADGQFPISTPDRNNAGVIGGAIAGRSNFNDGYDETNLESEQFSIELRLRSDNDGPFNWLLGAYYLDSEVSSDYFVIATALDYFAAVGAGVDGVGLVAPFFNNLTDEYSLTSYAGFGEVYYDFTETFSITAGMRYSVDDKFIRDRQVLFDTAAPIGTVDANPILAGVDKDPATPGVQPFREQDAQFREVTGRFVAEWTPDLSFTDSTNIYFSYSRGYKSGGINPAIDPALFPDTEVAFAPEFINAFEIGTKNELFNGRLQASLAAFYYDYSGLQVSRIVNRTSVNENIDATIWGFEGEFLAAPIDSVLLNLGISYLNTEIGESTSVDGRDPTDGRDDVTLIKDLATTANCVVEHNGGGDLISSGAAAALGELGIPFIPAETPGIAFAGFGVCDALAQGLDALGLPQTVSGGVAANLEGNELQNSPNWTISMGGQYTYDFDAWGRDLSIVSRVDYYWQGDMYARIFNAPIDEIGSWDQLNASVTLYGPDQQWYLRGFVQNALDSDNITGHYFTDPSSGNFTNIFVLDPRLFGVQIGYTF